MIRDPETDLFLVLKRQWFEMILSGNKTEEYRRITPYWSRRLQDRTCKTVTFQFGYGAMAPRMQFEVRRIGQGYGLTIWGAERGRQYYVIELGRQLMEFETHIFYEF